MCPSRSPFRGQVGKYLQFPIPLDASRGQGLLLLPKTPYLESRALVRDVKCVFHHSAAPAPLWHNLDIHCSSLHFGERYPQHISQNLSTNEVTDWCASRRGMLHHSCSRSRYRKFGFKFRVRVRINEELSGSRAEEACSNAHFILDYSFTPDSTIPSTHV